MENLTDITMFVRVVEGGSFTAAADKLGSARSVVSKPVPRLEARLGVRLLNRTTRRLSLTARGSRSSGPEGLIGFPDFNRCTRHVSPCFQSSEPVAEPATPGYVLDQGT